MAQRGRPSSALKTEEGLPLPGPGPVLHVVCLQLECSCCLLLAPDPPSPPTLWLILPPAPSISILLRVSVRLWTFLFLCEFCAFVISKNIDKLCASVKDLFHFTSLADFISFRRYRSQRRVSLYAKSIRPFSPQISGLILALPTHFHWSNHVGNVLTFLL